MRKKMQVSCARFQLKLQNRTCPGHDFLPNLNEFRPETNHSVPVEDAVITTEDIIVGSGPAGVATAHALLARGRKVRMLDVGVTLEPEGVARRDRMGSQLPTAWAAEDLRDAQAPRRAARTDGMRPYGSDFATRDVVDLMGSAHTRPSIALRPSFARGGLSNGWGSAVTPYRIEDMGNWPDEAKKLAPHYQAVSAFMPISARKDDLEAVFPMWRVETPSPLPPSSTADALMARLDARRDTLLKQGVRFGQARQAVRTGCRVCGMCLYGCPYKLIFNAGCALDELMKRPDFTYEPGRLVFAFTEGASDVRVHSTHFDGTDSRTHTGAKLFIATGVLPTAKLILDQPAFRGQTLTLLDSQQMLLPTLQSWAVAKNFRTEQRHTLAQLFIEIMDESVSSRTVHAQLYTYNDLFPLDMRARFGALAPALGPMIDALCRRLIVAQAFLHSDESARISIQAQTTSGASWLECTPLANEKTADALQRVKRKLSKTLLMAGVHALGSQARIGAPGSSFHCGGSLPMHADPSGQQTDVYGRLPGLKNVHIVDASVLPSIPATTITFSVMANAHRIASTAPL